MTQGTRIHISAPVIVDRPGWRRASYKIDGLEPGELWFDVSADFAEFVDHGANAPLLTLLLPAMLLGRDIEVEAPLSRRLAWNLENVVIPLSIRTNLDLKAIRVHSASWSSPKARLESTSGAATTGISCGVDSFSLLQDHLLNPDVRPEDRITHVLFNHIGSHGESVGGADLQAEVRWERARVAAQALGVPVIRVNSNQQAFYGYYPNVPISFPASLTVRNAAIPLLLSRGVRTHLVAGGCPWEAIQVKPVRDQGYFDAILVPALGTEEVELRTSGQAYTRTEKTKRIADLPIVRETLDVCVRPGKGTRNCSRCQKCLRTLMTLEVLGRLEAFDGTFDLEIYRRNRIRAFAGLLRNPAGLYEREILDLMKERGFKVPAAARVRRVLEPWANRLRRIRGS